MKIFGDVNLSGITISRTGREIFLEFLDMYRGEYLSTIRCNSVYLINYHNNFSEEDDGFACYVGEVTYNLIKNEEVNAWLTKKNFGFVNIFGGKILPTTENLFHLHLESGEIVIDILCEKLLKDDKEILCD